MNVIADEVGQAGRVIEPRNAADCKGIASMASPAIGGGYGYGVAALRYGSRGAPFQLFAQLPTGDTGQPATQTLDRIADVMPAGTIAWVQDVETLNNGQTDRLSGTDTAGQ